MWSDLRVFLRSITPTEWKRVFWCALLLAGVTTFPVVYGYVIGAMRDMVWTGRQFLAPGDTAVYLSYIEQIKQGSWLVQDWYTTEQLPATFNIFWLVVGLGARIFSAPALIAFHVARIVLIFPLVAVVYILISWFFSQVRERWCALLLTLFG